MKAAIIGYGNVGMAVFRELQDIRGISELTLIGRNKERMQAEVRDYLDAAVLRNIPGPELSFGGYEATAGADIIIYTAGATNISGDDRNSLLTENIRITKEVFDEVNKYNLDAIVIVVTNPLDVIVKAICSFTGRPASKVIGTGNMLETARLTAAVSEACGISPKSVQTLSIGEHGNSAVVVSSYSRICGMTVKEYAETVMKTEITYTIKEIEDALKAEPFSIYYGKGSTAYGVAMCAAKLVQAIIMDTREIVSASTVLDGEYGINGFAVSVPCVIGKEGRVSVHVIPLEDDETQRLAISAETIRKNCELVELL